MLSGHFSLKTSLSSSWLPVLALIAGILVVPPPVMQAADDLLDPSKIGSARKSTDAPDLLDPVRASARASSPAAGTVVRRHAGKTAPDYARDMAATTAGSLNGLTQAAASLVDTVTELGLTDSRLSAKLLELIADMTAEMADYRAGLFCSGCGETKTAILAKGDTFPHPGQKIVKPTAEEIAAKERELQRPIDATQRELEATRIKRREALAERDEALAQIDHGLKLWRTAVIFEDILHHRRENEAIAIYKSKRTAIEDQLRKLGAEKFRLTDTDKRAEITREIKQWTATLENLDAERKDDRREFQNDLDRANAVATAERDLLNTWLARGQLGLHTSPLSVATTAYGSMAGGDFELGGLYRMGDHSVARHDEVLPSVNRFIVAVTASPNAERVSAANRRAVQPPAEPTVFSEAKGKLRDLLDPAPPSSGDPVPPKRSGGTGLRD